MPIKKKKTKTVKKAAKKKTKKAVKSRVKTVAKRSAVVKPIGKVTHFYGGIKVAVARFSKETRKGVNIRFEGATTKFSQKLESIQYEHKSVSKAPKGKQVGIKVRSRVREGDLIYIV